MSSKIDGCAVLLLLRETQACDDYSFKDVNAC